MTEVFSTFQLKLSEIAPVFELPDGNGNSFSLNDLIGRKGTLICFVCNHCPFVIHLASEIGLLAKDLKTKGINTVAINSNDIKNYPQDDPQHMLEFSKQYHWDFPYLYDESQEIAKAYKAACTPDFFLFNQNKALVYTGQFDNSRPKNEFPVTGESLRQAIKYLLNNKAPLEKQQASSGCNIKWKSNNAPKYFSA